MPDQEYPYWWPVITDAAWCEQVRLDYTEPNLSDEAIRDEYADGSKYSTLWDHTGDALEDWEKLADYMFTLSHQRDELLKALKEMLRTHTVTESFPMEATMLEGWLEARKMSTTAIAAIEEATNA